MMRIPAVLLTLWLINLFAPDTQAQMTPRVSDVKGITTLWAERQRELWLRYMNLRIADMDRECELSDSQMRRLQIAAKGVVQRRVKFGAQHIYTTCVQMGLIVPEIEDANPEPVAEDKDDPDYMIVTGARFRIGEVPRVDFSHSVNLTSHPRWKKAVDRTLNSEQKRIYTQSTFHSSWDHCEEVIHTMLSQMDNQLMLSNQQYRKLDELFVSRLRDKINDESPDAFESALDSFEQVDASDRDIKANLTEQQAERWENFINKLKNQGKQLYLGRNRNGPPF